MSRKAVSNITSSPAPSATSISALTLPEILTPEECAELLKVSLSTIYSWTRSRRAKVVGIPYKRLGGKFIRFEKHSVLRWFESLGCAPSAGLGYPTGKPRPREKTVSVEKVAA